VTKKNQTNIFNFLLKNGIKNSIGISDLTLRKFIHEELSNNNNTFGIHYDFN
jgi:hypothetical protein|tara:strand:+ start:86 stop:241 length:156 start_codon:yes stop_codon:yes gene_type:complete